MKKNAEKKVNAHHLRQYPVPFSLSFLDEDLSGKLDIPPYEYELLTSEEKANYFEHLDANGGEENVFVIAKDCKKRAAALRRKASRLDKKSAQPLIDHAVRLEHHARSITDVVPDDVLASQLPF